MMVRLQQDRGRYHLIRILYVPLSILSSNTAAKHITAFDVIYSIVCIRETFVFLVHPHKQARAPVKMAPGLGRSHMYSRPGEKVIWNISGTIFFSPNNFARTALQLYLAFYGFCSAVLCRPSLDRKARKSVWKHHSDGNGTKWKHYFGEFFSTKNWQTDTFDL